MLQDAPMYSYKRWNPGKVSTHFLITLTVSMLAVGGLTVSAGIEPSEREAVVVPLQNYLRAHATGEPEYARRAFHTVGTLIWIKDGQYFTESFDAFIKRAFTGQPAADEEKRKDQRKIESVDIAGNAASAKIVLDYPTVKFVDYMTLLKLNGEWKIVSKTFYAEPRKER